MFYQVSKITKNRPKITGPLDFKLVDIDFNEKSAKAIFNDGSDLNVGLEAMMDIIPERFQVNTTKQLYVSHR